MSKILYNISDLFVFWKLKKIFNGHLIVEDSKGKYHSFGDNKNLLYQFLRHPLMSFKVIAAIHFEALRLWIKGVKLVKRKIKIRNNLSIEN